MPEKQIPLPQWILDQKKYQDEHQFYKLPEGETEIYIDISKPVQKQKSTFDSSKDRFVYSIQVDGKPYTMSCGYMLDALIIKALIAGMNPMRIIRAGAGTNTRFSIKGLK